MRSRVTFLRHPLHPILVMFPVAMLPLLLILDIVALYAGEPAGWWMAGFLIAAVGGLLGLLASVPGIVDLAAIPERTRAHRIGVQHLLVGILILVVFGATLFLRWPVGSVPANPLWILGVDALGTAAVGLQGWLGGELVYKHHVGVDAPVEGGEPTELKPGQGLHVPPPRPADRRDLR